jgi:hypothetical protein
LLNKTLHLVVIHVSEFHFDGGSLSVGLIKDGLALLKAAIHKNGL